MDGEEQEVCIGNIGSNSMSVCSVKNSDQGPLRGNLGLILIQCWEYCCEALAWARARLGPGPGLGPGSAWAQVRLGPRPGLAQALAQVRPALHKDLCMVSLFLPHPSQGKAGRTCFSWEGVVECDGPCARRVALFPGPDYTPRGWLVTGLATCLAQGLLFAFPVFASPEPVQSGRTFFCECIAKCDLACTRQVALLPWEATLHTPLTRPGWNLEKKRL